MNEDITCCIERWNTAEAGLLLLLVTNGNEHTVVAGRMFVCVLDVSVDVVVC